MDKKVIISTVFSIALFFFLSQFIPGSHCGDGWNSPSIGSRGACSHHGGVTSYGHIGLIFFTISTLTGFFLYNLLINTEFQKKLKSYIYNIGQDIKSFFFSIKGLLLIVVISVVIGIYIGDSGVISDEKVMNNKLQDISKKSTDSIKRNLNVSKPTRQTYYQEIKQNSLIGNNSIPKQRIQTIIPELLNETTPQKDCGIGGSYSDILSKCSCNPGYGIGADEKCEKKPCPTGLSYSSILEKCTKNRFQIDYSF